MLDAYKKEGGDWVEYERRFLALIADRRVEQTLSRSTLESACLLCSEDKPNHCHRRLVVEYLKQKWGNLEVEHL
jgi:uncharacterized protein (DUF488 family)